MNPADYDPKTGYVSNRSFHKAYQNGLSVIRSTASDDDILALAEERLTIKRGAERRTVLAIFEVECFTLKSLVKPDGSRLCCIYDETVPPKYTAANDHVPTHASVYQRPVDKGVENRKQSLHADNLVLSSAMIARRLDVADFRDGLLVRLNERSLQGDFERDM